MSMMFDTPLGPVGQLSKAEKRGQGASGKSFADIAMVVVAFAFVIGMTLFAGVDRSIFADPVAETIPVSAALTTH